VQAMTQAQPFLHAVEAWQVLHSVSQAPPAFSAVIMHESQVPPEPVVPPVEPVVPPVEPVVPPPHSEAHSEVQAVEQMQSKMLLSVVWLAAGAALVQLVWQVASLQPWRQLASVAQAESAWQAATCEAQAPLDPCASPAQVWQSAPEVEPVVPPVEPVVPPVEPVVAAELEHQLVTIWTAAWQFEHEVQLNAVPSAAT